MSGKVKMRCARCGKSFKSSGAKQTLCLDCEAKARQERAATRAAGPKAASAAPAQTQAPKIVGPGASILVPGMVPTETDVPPEVGAFGRRYPERNPTETRGRPGAGQHPSYPPTHPSHGPAAQAGARMPPHAAPAGHEKPPRPTRPEAQKQPKTPKAPREPREPRPAVPVIELTDELRQKIEGRYMELANPVEFDGIRTQIAGDLGVPKALVKRAVLELRGRMQMPSWWELQSYTGGNSDLERIRRAYIPLLPVPEIGVHKAIATQLGLEPAVVYQGIKRIRAEMRLPRYNPPELHEGSQAGEADTPHEQSAANGTEVSVTAPGAQAR